MLPGGGYYADNADSSPIDGTDDPWLYASGARGIIECSVPLLGEADGEAAYRVELFFAEPEAAADAGSRVFDIKLQGQVVAADLDVAREAGGARRAWSRAFSDIPVVNDLRIELVPRGTLPPILSAIRVERQ
jgi:beta-galactosidase